MNDTARTQAEAALARRIAKHRPATPDPVLTPKLDAHGINIAAAQHWARRRGEPYTPAVDRAGAEAGK